MKTIQKVVAVIVAVLTTSCATVQWTESTVDVALIETAYRQLIDQYKPTDPIFLSTGFDHRNRVYSDPPAAVFENLSDLGLRLRPGSEVGFTDVGVVEKESGKEAIIFVVSIKQRTHDGVLLECGHYKNMLDSSGREYKATRSDGRWQLTESGRSWISQREPNQQIQAIAAERGSS